MMFIDKDDLAINFRPSQKGFIGATSGYMVVLYYPNKLSK